MNAVQIKITPTEILIYEEQGVGKKINEELYPELRNLYSNGLYDAFLDKNTNPFTIKYIRKIL